MENYCKHKQVQYDDCYFKEKYNDCECFHNHMEVQKEKMGIYKRFKNIDFKSVEARGVPVFFRKQFNQVLEYAKNPNIAIEGNGLILQGGVGTLKTTLAICCLVQFGQGFFISMPTLLDTLFSLKAKGPDECFKFETKIKTSKLLVIDDLGAEHTEGWVLTKVDAIISERYNRQLANIITTNLTGEQLRKTYAERIIDRLKSTSKTIVFNGPSLRSKK